MYRLTLCGVLAATLLVPSCSSPEEHTTEVISGAFKLMLRSQEYHHSGIRNVDIRVAEASAQKFPSGELQCFFHGFDFSGLSVGWRTGREIDVCFLTGRVRYFTNYSSVIPTGYTPVEFHVSIHEGVDATKQAACIPQQAP